MVDHNFTGRKKCIISLCVYVCACVRALVRARTRACLHVYVHLHMHVLMCGCLCDHVWVHECMCSLMSRRTAVSNTHLFIRAVHAEVVFEITVGHQLHDDQSRLSLGHHANQLDHVVTVECPAKAKTATSSSAPLHVSQLHKYHKNTKLVQG